MTCFIQTACVVSAVLPSSPRDFHLVGRSSTWLRFAWKKPLKNADIIAYLLLVNSSTARGRRIDVNRILLSKSLKELAVFSC